MSARFFGTDGIRGRVGDPPLTPQHVLRVAVASAQALVRDAVDGDRVVIGTDTRSSGDWISAVLAAGFSEQGLDVVMLGVLPTPALAFAATLHGARFGVMVTASHNPAGDNGIKLFGGDGFKLPAETEAAIEQAIATPQKRSPLHFEGLGAVTPDPSIDVRARYLESRLASLRNGTRFDGLKIVVDAANGAAFDLAPYALRQLGAEVRTIGTTPNGRNINDQVGSTHPLALAKAVRASGASAGVALDGDADRLIMVDETGAVIDGDQLIALIAAAHQRDGRLTGGSVVTTVMSNLGLERHLATLGLGMVRTKVGDKHVVDAMRTGGQNVGGEQSGHIVLMDHATTGDGLLTALHVLSELATSGRPMSVLSRVFDPAPQKLVNLRFSGEDPLASTRVQDTISAVEAELGDTGRLVVRKSGTEPLIRIMAEALDETAMQSALDRIVAVVEAETA